MGAKYLARNVDVLAVNGRLVVIGLQGGTQGRAGPRRADAQAGAPCSPPRCGPGRPTEKAAIVRVGPRARLAAARSPARYGPVVDRVLPMTDAAEAHRVVEASAHVGKVLLTVGGA